MKTVYWLLCFSLLSIGCDNRDEVFVDWDTAPILRFEGVGFGNNEAFIVDSLKVSKNISQAIYTFTLMVDDQEGNASTLSYSMEIGSGILQYRGQVVHDKMPLSAGIQNLPLQYIPVSTTSTLLLTVHDKLGKSGQAKLELRTFKNLLPIAKVSFREFKVNSPYEYMIDASESFDRDEKFGGKIIKYKYQINNKEFFSTKSEIKFIFPGPGNYSITVQVEDNDHDYSEPITEILTISEII